MKIAIKDIVIKDRVRKSIGGIRELANNIRAYGLINPISIYRGTKELKAGIRRIEAAKELGWTSIEFRYVDYDVEASENLFREDLTPEEKVKAVERLAEETSRRAKERQQIRKGNQPGASVVNLPPLENSKTRDIIARDVGWSGKTYEKAKKVIESGNREAIDKMNKVSVDAGFKKIKPGKETKYDTKGLSDRTFDFLEWLSHRLQEPIDKLMEVAVLDHHKEWLVEYNSYGDDTRLKVHGYRSHMFGVKEEDEKA